jgi:uncharacterized protein (TIGR03435 family)
MIQTLLAVRFRLKLHHEMKELSVYALVMAKNGPKVTPAAREEGKPPGVCPGGPGLPGRDPLESAFLRSWERIETLLSVLSGRPVIDKPGLEDAYCIACGLWTAGRRLRDFGLATV